MKYFFWRLFGRCFWIQLSSRWRDPETGNLFAGEWQQKRSQIRSFNYSIVGRSS